MGTYKVTGTRGRELETEVLLHPGEVLRDELEARAITQKQFGETVSMKPSHLNELIKGKRNISALLALRIERALGISAAFWMRLQVEYDLHIARQQFKKVA